MINGMINGMWVKHGHKPAITGTGFHIPPIHLWCRWHCFTMFYPQLVEPWAIKRCEEGCSKWPFLFENLCYKRLSRHVADPESFSKNRVTFPSVFPTAWSPSIHGAQETSIRETWQQTSGMSVASACQAHSFGWSCTYLMPGISACALTVGGFEDITQLEQRNKGCSCAEPLQSKTWKSRFPVLPCEGQAFFLKISAVSA